MSLHGAPEQGRTESGRCWGPAGREDAGDVATPESPVYVCLCLGPWEGQGPTRGDIIQTRSGSLHPLHRITSSPACRGLSQFRSVVTALHFLKGEVSPLGWHFVCSPSSVAPWPSCSPGEWRKGPSTRLCFVWGVAFPFAGSPEASRHPRVNAALWLLAKPPFSLVLP